MLKTVLTIAALLMYGGSVSKAAELPVSMTINSTQSSVTHGDDIRVNLILTNNSPEQINFFHRRGSSIAEREGFVVIGPNGKPAAEWDDGPRISGPAFEILQPGDEVHGSIILTKVYDMTQPGTYAIQFHHVVGFAEGGQDVSSNTVYVTVK